jgi:hypothetical protein
VREIIDQIKHNGYLRFLFRSALGDRDKLSKEECLFDDVDWSGTTNLLIECCLSTMGILFVQTCGIKLRDTDKINIMFNREK